MDMNILMVTSETVPFSKSGGLADVVGALSQSLSEMGHEIRVFMPMYSFIDRDDWKKTLSYQIPMLGKNEKADILEKKVGNVTYVGFAHPYFTTRKGIYGDTSFQPYSDNCPRFLAFAKAAALYLAATDWKVDIVHCHDWTTGLVPHYLKHFKVETKTVFTIHNLAYQGVFPLLDAVISSTRIPKSAQRGERGHKTINMMAAGLLDSDYITTVSPNYMEEIKTEDYGCSLSDIIRKREESSRGIINGIDYDEWNPEKDGNIKANFSSSDLKGKEECKKALLEEFRIEGYEDKPLFSMISRLADQKGFDELLLEGSPCALERILEKNDSAFVIIGTGDSRYVTKLSLLMAKYKTPSVKIAFSQPLSHMAEAGADFFLMPSRFEPCGLNQLYSMRYGTLPVVNSTGGLKDSVKDMAEEDGTGFIFSPLNPDTIVKAVERAVEFHKDKEKLKAARIRAMEIDSTWKRSAEAYEEVYRSLI